MANTIQSDFTYLWLDCSGHGWKASLGLTRCISSGTVPHECSYALSEASSAVERIHLLLWEPSWLHPEAAQVFQHQSYWRGFGGEGARRRSRNTQPRSWIQLSFGNVALHQLCQTHAASRLLHLLHRAPGPTGLISSGTTGWAPQAKSHGLSTPAVLGNRLWVRSREINGTVESV